MAFSFYKNEDTPTEFCNLIVETMADFVGVEYVQSVILKTFTPEDLSLDKKGRITFKEEKNNEDKIRKILVLLVASLEKDFGQAFSEEKIRHGFLSFAKNHTKDEDFLKVVSLIPSGYLENEKLRYLSKEELENTVREKIRELQKTNEDLEERVKARTENLEKANEELKKLDKAKSHFISIVAHQLRTPLTGIKWSLDFLKQGGAGDLVEKQKEVLGDITAGADQMSSLMDDFLNVDNLQSGALIYDFKQIYVADIIEDILKKFTLQAREKNITLELTKEDNLPLVSADPFKLKIVLQNLIENAIKYTSRNSKNGSVKVSIKTSNSTLRITITDTGIGIPKDQQPNIFQRFFRAQNAYETEPNGSGLGLFIAQEIIEGHKGKISFESKENAGTTFTVELPVIK